MSSSAFKELFRIVDTRFAYASNVSELTTGRTELWANYLHEFTHNPLLTVFGEGYTSVNLNGKASHNSIIQAIYQFGIVGLPLIALWAASVLRKIFSKQKAGLISRRHVLLMGIGIVLPWMGLDILFFDEFFLLPVYGALGVLILSDAPSSA